MIVYVITNTLNGRQYIGATRKRLSQRWSGHLMQAKKGKESELHVDMRRYGFAVFSIEPIATPLCEAFLYDLEMAVIRDRGTRTPAGYSQTDGGAGVKGRVVKDEARADISAARRGKPLSAEHRAKLSATKTGKHPLRTEKHNRKIAEGLKRAHARRKGA